jgi:hypothetical protein
MKGYPSLLPENSKYHYIWCYKASFLEVNWLEKDHIWNYVSYNVIISLTWRCLDMKCTFPFSPSDSQTQMLRLSDKIDRRTFLPCEISSLYIWPKDLCPSPNSWSTNCHTDGRSSIFINLNCNNSSNSDINLLIHLSTRFIFHPDFKEDKMPHERHCFPSGIPLLVTLQEGYVH